MENLKKLRKSKGLTLQQLAKELGVVHQGISRYELGQREPDFDTLKKMADYFNVSIDYLIGYEGNNRTGESMFSEEELQLVENYRVLSRDNQLQLIGYIRALMQMQGQSPVNIIENKKVNSKL